jgi:hypothetical protein
MMRKYDALKIEKKSSENGIRRAIIPGSHFYEYLKKKNMCQ